MRKQRHGGGEEGGRHLVGGLVGPRVFFQMILPTEAFPAGGAGEGPDARVDPLVPR